MTGTLNAAVAAVAAVAAYAAIRVSTVVCYIYEWRYKGTYKHLQKFCLLHKVVINCKIQTSPSTLCPPSGQYDGPNRDIVTGHQFLDNWYGGVSYLQLVSFLIP